MNQLVEMVENELSIKTPNIKVPFFIGILVGYILIFYHFYLIKNL